MLHQHAGAGDTPAEDGRWPDWARPQLRHGLGLALRIRSRGHQVALAPELYRTWFNAPAGNHLESARRRRPLAGVYRSAHAGSGTRVVRDGLATVCRSDAIGRDGWWRTWGEHWRPRQSREASVRVVLTPRPDALAELVRELTVSLAAEAAPWMLACSTDARRLRRVGGFVLHVPHQDALPAGLVGRIAAMLQPVTPPLCLPLAVGVGLADTPANGMSFGEFRCHLLALGLGTSAARHAPLRAIAEVFAAHGVDPGTPWVSPRAQRPVLADGLRR